MEQRDRERSLIKFRNGTSRILLATDLAARGIDIPEIKYIIHYELPFRIEEFTHRNVRTARVNKEGTAYVFKSEEKELPEFIKGISISCVAEVKTFFIEVGISLIISFISLSKPTSSDLSNSTSTKAFI